MNEANLTVRAMYWYKRIGRIIYLILFSASLIETIVQGISRKPYFLGLIFIDVTIALLGLWLEAADNPYSVFAVIGEIHKTENIKIIVKDKEKDIRKI